MARTRKLVAGVVGLAAITLGGCVESFGGSNLQFDFAEGMPTATRPGQTPDGPQPPENTYYVFYAVDHIYEDESAEDPVVVQSYVYEVHRFEIRPVIDTASPCLIDLPDAAAPNFPGLHVTMFEEKVKETTGITDPFDPPDGVTEGQISDVLNAGVRMGNLTDLEGMVKAVTTYSTFTYHDVLADDDCDFSGDEIPGRTCMDEASNAQRLRACRLQWAEDPNFYEGSDKVFTLPLNGSFYGNVEGANPINSGFLGGAQIFVDEVLEDFDAYAVNWKFKDESMNSVVGTPFIAGVPEERTRGVIHVRMQHADPDFATIAAEAAIFPGLGEDHVSF